MFLESLQIRNTSGLIRKIDFQRGVNLIVDSSAAEDKTGNSVGKTTVLRLVDFCLGGKPGKIYEDPEFGTNSEVKSFLEQSDVTVTLTLARFLGSASAPKLVIERNFLSRGDAVLRINGESVKRKDFEGELARRLFRQEEEKPTFRQLIAKNIRDEDNRLAHILQVLHSTTSNVEYQTLFRFWMGVDSSEGAEHEATRRAFNRQKSYRTELAKEINPNTFSVLPDIEASVEELTDARDNLDFPEDYQRQLDAFDEVKKKIGRIGAKLSAVSLRRELIVESKEQLKDDFSSVSTEEIEALYSEAEFLIPNLQKTFEESVHFHNQMIQNKLEFISREIPGLENKEAKLRSDLAAQEEIARKFQIALRNDKTLDALNRINSQLQALVERQARLREQQRIWETCIDEYERLEKRLATFTEKARSQNEEVAARLEVFNKHFKRISQELYGETYKLTQASVDEQGNELDTLKFTIEGVSANPGTGEKKGQITAFDLAYIAFAEELGIPHVNFVLHDQIENVDDRQIITILDSLVPSVNAQYIAPILRDKIPDEISVEKYSILELSHSDKLFRL